MFSKSRNNQRHRIGNRAAGNRLRDRDNSAEIGNNSAGIGDNSAEIGNDAAWIVNIATNVIPC